MKKNDLLLCLQYLESYHSKSFAAYRYYSYLERNWITEKLKNHKGYKKVLDMYSSGLDKEVNELAFKAVKMSQLNNHHKAISLLKRALEKELETEQIDKGSILFFYKNLMLSSWFIEDSDNAFKYAEQALKHMDESRLHNKYDLLFTIGQIFSLNENYDKAESFFLSSLKIAEEMSIKGSIHQATKQLSNFYGLYKVDNVKSIKYGKKALQGSIDYDNKEDILWFGNRIVRSYYNLENEDVFQTYNFTTEIVDSIVKYYSIVNKYGYWDLKEENDIEYYVLEYLATYYLKNILKPGMIDNLVDWGELAYYLAKKHGNAEEMAKFSLAIGIPLSIIDPQKAIPFLKETYHASINSNHFAEIIGNEGLLFIRQYLRYSYSSVGDSINAIYHLEEGLDFVENNKMRSPLADFYRAENYFHKKDFKNSKKFYKKVYNKVDRNDTNINWLYGDAYAATLSIDLIQNKTKGLNKRVEKFYNESKSSNVAKQKKNALILRWLINVINNDIEISDSSLDELIDLYRTQSETFFTYETKYLKI